MRKIILLLCFVAASCSAQPEQFTLYTKGGTLPEVAYSDNSLKGIAQDFCNYFEQLTGEPIVPQATASSSKTNIVNIAYCKCEHLKVGQFTIMHEESTVKIEAKNKTDIEAGIRYFFRKYANAAFSGKKSKKTIEEILLPSNLIYTHKYAFEYREPYFPDNFNPEYRKWNTTHTLEENCGIWGHNIGKAIKVTPAMYATVDGALNAEQLCFSSRELEDALTGFIKRIQREEPSKNKFMVMPYDNHLVCTCNGCKAVGNNRKNASPAVFSLLNKLAVKFPEQEFFSTAYVTTQKPPAFKLAANAGVMVSTMDFPKGVVIEKSESNTKVKETFQSWRAITNKIYLWDYAVNFDNYFDAYPTVSITRKNLKYYKQLGVTGVFMHGSEEYYSAFSDLKSFLYAQLMQDLDADIKKLTVAFYSHHYPGVGDLLSKYYSDIEALAYSSPRQLDIYGGIVQSEKKYLKRDAVDNFYTALTERVDKVPASETAGLKPLLASVMFQRLELMRTAGLMPGGYGSYNNNTATIGSEVYVLLDALERLCDESNIKTFNEGKASVRDYIQAWKTDITEANYKNLVYGKTLRFTSVPDEDYSNIKMLTDGAIGFTDYYNNWLLSTRNELSVEIDVSGINNANTIELSFLSDERHKIYLPEKVIVEISGRTYQAKIPKAAGHASKQIIAIPVKLLPTDKIIRITTEKQKGMNNKSIACDEVYLK